MALFNIFFALFVLFAIIAMASIAEAQQCYSDAQCESGYCQEYPLYGGGFCA